MGLDLEDWLQQIETYHPEAIKLGLDRLKPIATKMGLIHFSCPVITVAGTNGKGTVVNGLAELFHRSGYRVGAYLSPHIFKFNERIQLQRESVSDELLCSAFSKIDAARGNIPLTYFEFTTLAALLIFQQASLDVLVLEVGLGGRLDAVNIVEPDVCVITSIGLDHQSWLGDTREAIAVEKAGIMRAHKPVVIGDPNPPANLVEIAHQMADPVLCYGQDFLDAPVHFPQLVSSNVACVWEVARLLEARLPVNLELISKNWTHFSVTGRCETICENPLVIRDVSHNQDSYDQLANYLKTLARKGRRLAVFSCYRDKLNPTLLDSLKSVMDAWWIAPLAETRGASVEELLELLESETVEVCSDIPSAFSTVQSVAGVDDVIVVFGSFAVLSLIV